MEPGVALRYYGHACFLATNGHGTRVAVDPYDDRVGYPPLALAAEVCLVTHDHSDHSHVSAVSGSPEVIRTAGRHEASGIPILGVTASHHEPGRNAERGDIVMFRWTMDGVTLVHVGDLGTTLSAEQVAALGEVDLLLVPVGGFYTLDARQAVEVISALRPRIAVPMHYRTDASAARLSAISPVDDFLDVVPPSWSVARPETNEITVTQSELADKSAPTRVIVLSYR